MKEEVTTFTLRLPADLRKAFESAAKSNDRTSAQLVRDFMRDYVSSNHLK